MALSLTNDPEYEKVLYDLIAQEHIEALKGLDYLLDIGLKQLQSGEPMPPKRVKINIRPFGRA